MTKMYKACIVLDILKTDPNVREADIIDDSGEQVAFWTKDLASDEDNETGYYSEHGYDWDKFKGLGTETKEKLKQLDINLETHMQYNDCEGSENEGAIFID